MNRHEEGRSPNKQLVPLVRQDYITKPGGLFEAQFISGYRTADLSSIHHTNPSSLGESRLEFSKFLAGTGRKQSSRRDICEPEQVQGYKGIDQNRRIYQTTQNGQEIERKDFKLPKKEHSISLERATYTKSGELSMPFERKTANQPYKDNTRYSTEFMNDQESADDSSVEREIDISTYIKEQRKLIKRVKSGSKIPIAVAKKDNSINYEIKEFKRPRLNSKKDSNLPTQASKQENYGIDQEGTQEKFMRQFNKKTPEHDLYGQSSTIHTSKSSKPSYNFQNHQFKTYDGRESAPNSLLDSEVFKPKEGQKLGKSNREGLFGAKENNTGSKVIKRIIVGPSQTFDDVLRDESDSIPKPYRVDSSNERTQTSIGARFGRMNQEEKGKPQLTSGLSKKSSLDRLALKFNRCHTSTGFERSEPFEGSYDQNQKLSSNNLHYKSSEKLFVGEEDQNLSLAAHFRKKIGKTDSAKCFEKPKNSVQISASKQSPKGNDTSKLDLRKKMMDYGKKLERSRKPLRETEHSNSRTNFSISKASSNPNLFALGQRKASPKPEVLERLARGIKPQVEKSEIHEITRRHIEKFQKLNKQPDTPQANQVKKAELIERRNKVKELDMVTNSNRRKLEGISIKKQ